VLAYVPFLFGFAIAFSILLKVNSIYYRDAAFRNDEKVVFVIEKVYAFYLLLHWTVQNLYRFLKEDFFLVSRHPKLFCAVRNCC
jgi:hypothetical protein